MTGSSAGHYRPDARGTQSHRIRWGDKGPALRDLRLKPLVYRLEIGRDFACRIPDRSRIACLSSLIAAAVILGCAGSAPNLHTRITPETHLVLVGIIDGATLQRLDQFGTSDGRGSDPLTIAPISVAVGRDGTIAFSDRLSGRVIRLTHRGGTVGESGERSGVRLGEPGVVRLDPIGNIYACDVSEGRVGVFDARMRLLDWLTPPPFNALGLVPGRIGGIAFGPMGEFYLSDATNGRIYRYDAAGRFDVLLGDTDDLWARLLEPAGLATAAGDGALYISDPGAGQIVILGPDGLPRDIIGSGQLRRPVAVAVNEHGQVFVVDESAPAVLVFSPGGDLRHTITGSRLGTDEFVGPTDIYLVDSTIWIADPPAGRILEIRIRNRGPRGPRSPRR